MGSVKAVYLIMAQATDVIDELKLYMSDPDADFFDDEKCLLILNRALRSLSSKSKSICESVFRRLVLNQYNYALPDGTIEIKKVKYKNGTWVDLIPNSFDDVENLGSNQSGTIQWYAIGENARFERFVGVLNVRDIEGATGFGIDIEDDVFAKDIIYNLSDLNSKAIVTSSNKAEGQTNVIHTALTGGTRNRIEVGDTIRIISPHAPFKALAVAPASPKTDPVGEQSLGVFVTRFHRKIELNDLENHSDGLELDSELDDALLYECLHWGSLMYDGFKNDAANYKTMANTEYNKVIHTVFDRVQQNINQWERSLPSAKLEVILNDGGVTNWNDYTIG